MGIKGKSIRKCYRYYLATALATAMTITMIPAVNMIVNAEETTVLSNPSIVEDHEMVSLQNVTRDCVWFGSYPQSGVKKEDTEYAVLQSSQGWDSRNEITIEGERYLRMTREDATYDSSDASSGSNYKWEDNDTWHYFKYEPIKWWVLQVDGNQVLLLSDMVLDDRKAGNMAEWSS